ncbi:MAG: hypothetical protein LH473_05405 [Chitinophagales bacterium]|nr:hypothetical protein [Chitinophagales bacterium]
MRSKIFFTLIISFLVSGKIFSQKLEVKSFLQFDLQTETNIRAIEVLNDSVVWFAGSGGVYSFTNDNGATFTIDSLKADTLIHEFRSIAVLNEYTILLMNAGSPAYIFKSDDIGVSWKVVYENDDAEIFFDALKFADEKNGIAIGDPIRDCFQIIITHDGGETWQQVLCKPIPHSLSGEAAFASSNSSIDIIGKSIWFATGGLHSRVFASQDLGEHWKVIDAPIIAGKELTGIFSLDFFDRYNGIIGGGDYNDKASKISTVAITSDEGKIWKPIAEEDAPPFVSCIQYQPNSAGYNIIAACLPGIYLSDNKGLLWTKLPDENGNEIKSIFYTFRFSPSGKVAWFAGAKGKIARLELK